MDRKASSKGNPVFLIGCDGKSGKAVLRYAQKYAIPMICIDEKPFSSMSPEVRERIRSSSLLTFRCEDLNAPSSWLLSQQPERIILSPGVPLKRNYLRVIVSRGIEVRGEMDLGYELYPVPGIAVTGTDGKSTTVSMIRHIADAVGLSAVACGNFGVPLLEVAMSAGGQTLVPIIEVSSYQLESMRQFRCRVGVLTNIAPDHLDRYDSFDEYGRCKTELWNRSDYAVLRTEEIRKYSFIRSYVEQANIPMILYGQADEHRTWMDYMARRPARKDGMGNGCLFYDAGDLVLMMERWHGEARGIAEVVFPSVRNGRTIFGDHNYDNLALAFGALYLRAENQERLGRTRWRDVLEQFHGLPHRFEKVAEKNGVRFINDSKATTMQALTTAIKSLPAGRIILIAGGRNKGESPYSISPEIWKRTKAVFTIGEMGRTMLDAARGANKRMNSAYFRSLADALRNADAIAIKGDYVLFSPGFASFDMFKNFEHRGEVFTEIAQKLCAD